MKKRTKNFIFSIYCCLGKKLIAMILFYLLFLILHFEKNYLLMADYYNMRTDNFNSFVLFVFSDGFFLILFLPIVVLVISWKVYQFIVCDCLKVIKYKSRAEIVQEYIKYNYFITIGIMIYLVLGMFLAGKMIDMHLMIDDSFIANLIFAHIYMMAISMLFLLFAITFSSNIMGTVGGAISLLFELLVWKNHIKGMFAYTFFYNIVTQDDMQISFIQKMLFWILCLFFLISLILIVIKHVDMGICKDIKEIVRYITNKHYVNPWCLGAIIWSWIYVAMTFETSKKFYCYPKEFVYICFKGFSGCNVQDILFYLGLCLPLWLYLINYFSKYFTTFSVYMFIKSGGLLKHMLKCIKYMVGYSIFYFIVVLFLAYISENYIYKCDGKVALYQNLENLSGGIMGIVIDYILVSLLFVLFCMIIYLFCYRIEVAFLISISFHILNVVITNLVPYCKEFMLLTQNIILIRNAEYNMFEARCVLCISLVVMFSLFCYLIRKKQEKILTGCYI